MKIVDVQAERLDELARGARARSTRGYGVGPRAQQHEYQESSAQPMAQEASVDAQLLLEIHERQLRKRRAEEKRRREVEALHRAAAVPSRPRAEPRPVVRPEPETAHDARPEKVEAPLPPSGELGLWMSLGHGTLKCLR